ncbi:MAG: T9SS type A sorting domain-containing protein [Crocinitomicaceae bacterium]|nr:T9SS type A sorting domain-containing protein [Crocinitomicaceae bacterium]
MKNYKQFTFIVAILMSITSYSQCNTNTSICTTGTAGPFGFNTPGTPVSTCLDFFGPSVSYITLHITGGGPLEMLIDGSATTGFIDVSIFNVPPGMDPCTAITDNANEIGCNYASASSGCNQFGTSFGCPSSVPAPLVNAGDELMIVVENWSGSSFTFELELSGAGAQTGPPDPTVIPPGSMMNNDPPLPILSVSGGGAWSATCGACIDANTGVFDPNIAGTGNHTICYDIGTTPCDAQDCINVFVDSPLGVDIKYVDISCSDNEIHLNWVTIREDECDYFQLERSRDGINFEVAEIIKGNGTTSEETYYSFHETNNVENGYYRLLQVDFNGNTNIIGTYHANCEQPILNVFPNPGKTEVTLTYNNFMINQTTIELYDKFGRMISSQSGSSNGESKFSINSLNPGLYTFKIQDQHQVKTARFTKL